MISASFTPTEDRLDLAGGIVITNVKQLSDSCCVALNQLCYNGCTSWSILSRAPVCLEAKNCSPSTIGGLLSSLKSGKTNDNIKEANYQEAYNALLREKNVMVIVTEEKQPLIKDNKIVITCNAATEAITFDNTKYSFSEAHYIRASIQQFCSKGYLPACRIKLKIENKTRPSEQLSFCLSVENHTNELYYVGSNLKIVLDNNPYFIDTDCDCTGTLKPFNDSTISGRFVLNKRSSAIVSNFPKEVKLKLFTGINGYTLPILVKVRSDFLNTDFLSFAGRKYNILCFGVKRTGKTSFINAIHTLYSNGTSHNPVLFVQQTHKTGGQHVTTKYIKQDITIRSTGSSFPELSIWDTWGVDEENYKLVQVNHFIQGNIEENINYDNPTLSVANAEERKIHVVLLVLSLQQTQESVILQKMKVIYEKIEKANLPAIVVLTHADLVAKEKQSLNKEKISSYLGVKDESRVYLHTNYTTQLARSADIDFSTRKIMLAALKLSEGIKIQKHSCSIRLLSGETCEQTITYSTTFAQVLRTVKKPNKFFLLDSNNQKVLELQTRVLDYIKKNSANSLFTITSW